MVGNNNKRERENWEKSDQGIRKGEEDIWDQPPSCTESDGAQRKVCRTRES